MKPLVLFRISGRVHHNAVGLRLAAADPPPQLMELREAEALRVLNHHHRGVGHVYPDLHHRRGNQNVDRSRRKRFHDLVLFLGLHPAVEKFDPQPGKVLFQKLCIIQHVFRLKHFAFFHHRADHVSLVTLFYLSVNKIPCPFPIALIHYAVFHRKPVLGQLVDNGNIKISIQDDRQRPGDRRRAHDHNMRRLSLISQ